MNIKKRLAVSNLLMLLIPVAVVLVTGLIFLVIIFSLLNSNGFRFAEEHFYDNKDEIVQMIGKCLTDDDPTEELDALIRSAEKIAGELGIEVKKGVYLAGTGPSYETPSEYRYFRMIGADAVGMSTIPEVIAARHSSIPVFGMSVITNEAHDDYAEDYENNGDDAPFVQDFIYEHDWESLRAIQVAAADAAADRMSLLFDKLIASLEL